MTKLMLSLMLLVPLLNWAQTVTPQHVMHQAVVIDGKDHPELIPDAVAYRLVLSTISISATATDSERKLQSLRLQKFNLNPVDQAALIKVLAVHRRNFDDLIQNHNTEVAAAISRNVDPDQQSVIRASDALVNDTLILLQSSMTAEGFTNFKRIVQDEKRHMTVAAQ